LQNDVENGHPRVSIRSALFALKKIGAVTKAEQVLDKSWKKYKAKNRLDAYRYKEEAHYVQLLTL